MHSSCTSLFVSSTPLLTTLNPELVGTGVKLVTNPLLPAFVGGLDVDELEEELGFDATGGGNLALPSLPKLMGTLHNGRP